MDTGDQVILPLDNPAFIAGTVVIVAICIFLFPRLTRFDRWAESRGLRWMGYGTYIWPTEGRERNRPPLVGALLALAAVLAVAGALFLLSTR